MMEHVRVAILDAELTGTVGDALPGNPGELEGDDGKTHHRAVD